MRDWRIRLGDEAENRIGQIRGASWTRVRCACNADFARFWFSRHSTEEIYEMSVVNNGSGSGELLEQSPVP